MDLRSQALKLAKLTSAAYKNLKFKKKFKKTFIEQPVENTMGILIKLKRKVKLEMAM